MRAHREIAGNDPLSSRAVLRFPLLPPAAPRQAEARADGAADARNSLEICGAEENP